ncbi:MAG: hypothetical protein ACO22R_09350 [Chitinophagaceae bacterium]
MDIESLRDQSDLSFDTATAKKNALERAESRQIIAYNNHLFRADAATINTVSILKQQQNKFFILDVNNNPCEITDPQDFLNVLIQRNQETLNEYHKLYQQLKNKI